jgi:transglutaminase-like putative cysteine protease
VALIQRRWVAVHLDLDIQGHTNLVFSIAAAAENRMLDEQLNFSVDGQPIVATELVDARGTRLHSFVSERGTMTVDYSVAIDGRADPADTDQLDLVTFLRPSRYCESDSLTPMARAEFRGLSGYVLVQAVADWVFERLAYVSGSSLPTDGATRTILSRQGVCRDFAHVTIALLRALDVPARMVAVYAPGLSPMDFHAVTEAWVDGQWWVVDSTRLAPRQSLVRISTGRDAADTAWLTSNWTDLGVNSMLVTATADELPYDDHYARVQLG